MAEFLHEDTFNHKGHMVGGVSITDEELDDLNLDELNFSDQKINTNDLVEEFSEGTLFKIELDIEEEDTPDVENRLYEHTYDDIQNQLDQLFKYRRKHRRLTASWNEWAHRNRPIEEDCVIATLKQIKSDKTVFRLYGIGGTITVRPYQFRAIYPCLDDKLSMQVDLYDEVLAHKI